MVERPDAKVGGVFPWGEVRSQDPVTHHVDEGAHAVPAFVVEPDLRGGAKSLAETTYGGHAPAIGSGSYLHVVFCVQAVDETRQVVEETVGSGALLQGNVPSSHHHHRHQRHHHHLH